MMNINPCVHTTSRHDRCRKNRFRKAVKESARRGVDDEAQRLFFFFVFSLITLSKVMDDRWDERVKEYGAINITGFRIIETERPIVQQFYRSWETLDPSTYPGAGKPFISVRCILERGFIFEKQFRLSVSKMEIVTFLFIHDLSKGTSCFGARCCHADG